MQKIGIHNHLKQDGDSRFPLTISLLLQNIICCDFCPAMEMNNFCRHTLLIFREKLHFSQEEKNSMVFAFDLYNRFVLQKRDIKQKEEIMKRILGFLGMMVFALAQSAWAAPYPVNVNDYIDLDSYNSTTRAGAMTFHVEKPADTNLNITFTTFCLEYDATTYLNSNYLITALVDGDDSSYKTQVSNKTINTTTWNKIAWLYFNFDQGTLTQATGDDGKWSGLQYAFWELMGYSTSQSYGRDTYLSSAANAVNSGWTNNERVKIAVNSGQDVLVAAPVPEPTTMLLFGTGLLGLAGIARRKRS